MKIIFLIPMAIAIVSCLAGTVSAQLPKQIEQAYGPGEYRDLGETVYLHLNQELFLPGETLYFRGYILQGASTRVSQLSRLIHVVIQDPTGSVVDHLKFKGEDGAVAGSYTFSDNLPPGNYTVSAYTRWMENFEPTPFYQASVRIVDRDSEPIASGHKPEVTFFPEGESLIAGLVNKVVIKVNSNEKLLGKIEDDRGEAVSTVIFDEPQGRLAFGQFIFRPEKGRNYTLRFGPDSTFQYRQALPATEASGVLIKHEGIKGGSQRFIVQSTKGFDQEVGDVYLIIRNKGAIHSYVQLKVDGKSNGLVDIPVSSLPQGTMEALLVDSKGNLITNRWFVNRNAFKKPSVQGIKDTYQTREQVVLKVSLPDSPALSSLSASVSDRPVSKTSPIYNHIAQVPATVVAEADRDVQLFTMDASKPFTSVPTLGNTSYFYERYITIAGEITSTQGTPITDSLMIMLYSPGQDQLYSFYTRTDGTFEAPLLFDHVGSESFSYQIDSDREDLILTFKDATPELNKKAASVPIPSREVIETMLIRDEVSNIYAQFENIRDSTLIEEEEPTIYYEADYSIELDQFVRVPNLKEVVREYVPPAQVRRKDGKDYIRIFNKIDKNYYPKPALIFVDGIPVYNYDVALNLEMKDLKRVDIVQNIQKLTKYAEGEERGVIFIYTKGGDFKPDEDRSKYVANFKGLDEAEAYRPSVPEAESPKPYFSSLLLWEPEVKPDSSGEATIRFTTSDATGTYYITIQGITEEGEPVYYNQEFNVAYKPAQ